MPLEYISLILSSIGVIIPIVIVLEILFNKDGKEGNADKKTDWFFLNKKYNRKHDSRVDENQYKF